MKIKSFAILAMTGLLAASCAYIVPVMADEMNNNGIQAADQMSAPADMSSSPQNNDNINMSADNNSSMNMSADNNTTNNSNEQGSPDTATGDDDY